MATFVIYWSQDLGESQESPIDPSLVEFESSEKAVEHMETEGYVKWGESDTYFTSFHHVKSFAKILEPRKAEKPRTSRYPTSTVTH